MMIEAIHLFGIHKSIKFGMLTFALGSIADSDLYDPILYVYLMVRRYFQFFSLLCPSI